MTGSNTQARKLDLLRDVFGYAAFRSGQEAVIDTILAGRPVLAVMPTGSGQSLPRPTLITLRPSLNKVAVAQLATPSEKTVPNP